MSNQNKPQQDLSVLHPEIRDAVAEVQKKLNAEGHPFRVFEAYRTPQRQAFLYSKGRTRKGRRVTNAKPWSSFHQYGLAVDFVLYRDDIRGGWSWETAGKWGRSWQRLHEVAADFNLMPLSWEKPHLQMKGVSIGDLRNGRYPDGGDDAWAAHLEAMIIGWNRSPAAPDAPVIMASRPPLESGKLPVGIPLDDDDNEQDDEETEILRPASGAADLDEPAAVNNFPIVHPYVHKWEGGYVNHALDRGGPTNMGITLNTLRAWRGRSVTASDIKNLSKSEAWQIMKRNYYDVVHGDRLPLAVALAAHNAAVLHGPGRSGRFLQRAIVALGHSIEVDGIVGPETLGGVAGCDASALCDGFFAEQREYFRGIERNRPKEWKAFRKGWMRRFEDIKSSASDLAGESEMADMDIPLPIPRPQDIDPKDTDMSDKDDDRDRDGIGGLLGRLVERIFDRDEEASEPETKKPAKPDPDDPSGMVVLQAIAAALSKSGHIKDKQLTAVLEALAETRTEDNELTPVNGAFGKTIGRLLDGKKTAVGIVGGVLATLVPDAQLSAESASVAVKTLGPILSTLGISSSVLWPFSLAIGAWGVLGKVDKWVAKLRRR